VKALDPSLTLFAIVASVLFTGYVVGRVHEWFLGLIFLDGVGRKIRRLANGAGFCVSHATMRRELWALARSLELAPHEPLNDEEAGQ
jgi:hypothetical protein